MALFLSMIDENVQKELNKRANRVAKSANELVHSDHKHNVERGGVYGRSTWIRIVPNTKLEEKTTGKYKPRPILAGGLLYEKGETAPGEPINYGDPLGGIGSTTEGGLYTPRSYKGTQGGQAHRPAPGVQNIDVKQKGELGSLVEITIKWQCFTFDQLGELSYYYMRPGASVICEFGWSGSEIDKAPHQNPEQAMFNKKDWLNPNMEFYCGVITNFEWSAKDDGSFDCTTTLTSGGSLIVQQELRANQARPTSAAEKGFGNMRDFFVEEGGKQFFDFVVNYANPKASDTMGCYAGMMTDPNDKSKETKEFVMASIGWLEDNVFSKFLGFTSENGEKKSMEFRSIEWVPSKDGKSGKYMPTRMRGHSKIVSANCLEVFIPNRHLGNTITMGEFKEDDSWLSWFNPFDDNKEWHQTFPVFAWTDFFEPMDYYTDWDGAADAPKEQSDNVWSYRNIIMTNRAMRNVARNSDTVNEFFTNMFDLINGLCGNVWKFVVACDDDNTCRAKVLDMNFCDAQVKDLIGKTLGEITKEDEEAEAPVYKAYKFPAMGRNSIVKSQGLNMRIPDAAALTTMYGANSGEAAKMTGEDEEEGGGSGAQSDVTMNVMVGMSSADVSVKAKDELLEGLQSPGTAYGSQNPYWNIGNLDEGTSATPNTPENKGQLSNNHQSPWNQTGGWQGRVVEKSGTTTSNSGGDAIDASDQNSGRFATSDKGSDLAKVLKDLEGNHKLPKNMTVNSLLPGDEYGEMTNDPTEENALAFIIKFQEHCWSEYKATGGGWVLPNDLRDYWWWAIKYLPAAEGEEGTVMKTNYMLPLELELQLDGIGGIQYGNAWQSEYVPSKYLDTTLFQTTEVNHSISTDGWTTTLKGKMRYIDLTEIQTRAKTASEEVKEEKKEINKNEKKTPSAVKKKAPKPEPVTPNEDGSMSPAENNVDEKVDKKDNYKEEGYTEEKELTPENELDKPEPKIEKPKPKVEKKKKFVPKCFVAGTKVSMFDNSLKNIEDISIDDMVVSYQQSLGLIDKKVTNIITGTADDIIEITFDNGTVTRNTTTHPYYVFDKGWVSYNPEKNSNHSSVVGKMEIGDFVMDDNKSKVKVTDIKEIEGTYTIYNLSVEDEHNYFANSILVHNIDFK